MKVVITSYGVANPSILRVHLYTIDDNESVKDYELAIPIEEFTDDDGAGNVNIDGTKFQHVVSSRIVAAQNAANLAAYMDSLELEWELNITNQPVSQVKETPEGLTLAYGDESTDENS